MIVYLVSHLYAYFGDVFIFLRVQMIGGFSGLVNSIGKERADYFRY